MTRSSQRRTVKPLATRDNHVDYTSLLFVDCKTTVWEKPADQPAGQSNELIGLDIAMVDTTKNQIVEQETILIRPKKSKIGSYCYKLFGITQSQIDEDGVAFGDIYRKMLVHYMSRDKLWGSWGIYERYALDKQCKALELETLFTKTHHNIQHLYSVMMGVSGDKEPATIDQAMKSCELPLSDNAAVNVAAIYLRMAKGLRPQTKTRIVVPGQFGHTYRTN